MKSLLRKIHKWLGLLMVAQILAWMVSGFYFSIIPIGEIRGEHLTRVPEPLSKPQLQDLPGVNRMGHALDEHFPEGWEVSSLSAVRTAAGVAWEVEGMAGESPFQRLVDPDSGEVLPKLSREAAAIRAMEWLVDQSQPVSVEWIEPGSGATEFRGRKEAAWRVNFDQPESLRLYLHPWTGEIMARRTSSWRVFDFLWMLHIMDYDDRESFNHPLLTGFSVLAVLTALSGIALWTWGPTWLTRQERELPVERALELVLEEGLPAREEGESGR